MLQAIQKESTVWKARKSIMKRVMLRLFLGAFAIGDIAIHDHQFGDFSFFITNRSRHGFQDSPRSIFMADAIFELFADSRVPRCACGLQHFETIVGMDLSEGGGLSQFGG